MPLGRWLKLHPFTDHIFHMKYVVSHVLGVLDVLFDTIFHGYSEPVTNKANIPLNIIIMTTGPLIQKCE